MASPIVVACPQCRKQLKVPAEALGKRLRCKCGHVFAAGSAQARPEAEPEDDGRGYGVAEDEAAAPRCPHCANELENADARICLHCGYDTVTRQRVGTKKVAATTGGDQMMWLMPGFAALAGILTLIGFDVLYALLLPRWLKGGDWEAITYGGFRVWIVVATLFGMFFLGKFAVQRLLLHPKPPEREVH